MQHFHNKLFSGINNMNKFIKNQIIKSKTNIYDIASYCIKEPKYCEHNEFICEHILNLSNYKTDKFKLNKNETFCKIYKELNILREKVKISYSNNSKILANPKMSSKYLELKDNHIFYTKCITHGSPLLIRFLEFNNKIKKTSLTSASINIFGRPSVNDSQTQ